MVANSFHDVSLPSSRWSGSKSTSLGSPDFAHHGPGPAWFSLFPGCKRLWRPEKLWKHGNRICMPYANKTTDIFRSTFKIIYTCWRWVILALTLRGEMCITKKYKGERESSDRVSTAWLAEVPSKSIKAVYIQRRAARRTPGLVQPSFSCWSFTYCSGKICRKNSVASSVPLLSLGRLANEVEAWKQCGKIQLVTFHW